MRLIHEPAPGPDGQEESTVLATDVETAASLPTQTLGLMFRRTIPEEYALVFRFDGPKRRGVHMVFVPFPIDVLWIVDGVVQANERLRPWIGYHRAWCDTVVELPAGAAANVEPGDHVHVDA